MYSELSLWELTASCRGKSYRCTGACLTPLNQVLSPALYKRRVGDERQSMAFITPDFGCQNGEDFLSRSSHSSPVICHAVGLFRCTKYMWLNFMIDRTRWNCAYILDYYLDLADFAGDDVSVRKTLKNLVSRFDGMFRIGRKWCKGQLTRSGCLYDVFFCMFEWSWLDSSTPKN